MICGFLLWVYRKAKLGQKTLTTSLLMITLGEMQDVSGAAVHYLVLFKNLINYYLKVRSGTNQLHQGRHI